MSSSIAITRQWWQLFRGSPQGMPCYSISCAACTSTLPFSSFRIVLITSGGVQCCRRCIIEGQYVTVSFSFPTVCPLYSVSGGNAAAVAPATGLGISRLDKAVQGYLMTSLSTSTLHSYRTAVNSYTTFCHRFGFLSPFPTSEPLLAQFAAFLAKRNLSYGSNWVYFSGI